MFTNGNQFFPVKTEAPYPPYEVSRLAPSSYYYKPDAAEDLASLLKELGS